MDLKQVICFSKPAIGQRYVFVDLSNRHAQSVRIDSFDLSYMWVQCTSEGFHCINKDLVNSKDQLMAILKKRL